MLQNRRNTRIRPYLNAGQWFRRIVIIMSLLAVVPVLYGKGQQDDTLSRADELIADQHYNEALALLNNYAKTDPKKFDRIQAKIRKILQFREEYNTTAQALLDVMVYDANNEDQIRYLTNLLYALDPERTVETQDFINRTREAALFRYNRELLEKILVQGQRLIAEGNYLEALRTLTGGLVIYQAEFFRSGYGQAMEANARQGISTLTGNTGAFTSIMNDLQTAVNNLGTMTSQGIEPQNLAAYRNVYNNVGPVLDRLITLRNLFLETDRKFKDDLAQLQKMNPRKKDSNFLSFAIRLLEGETNADGTVNYGILGVFDTLWNKEAARARDLLAAKSLQVYDNAVNDAAAGNYSGVAARGQVLEGYVLLPVDLEIRWNRYDVSPRKAVIFSQTVPDSEAENYLKFRVLADTSRFWRTLAQLGIDFSAVPQRDALSLWQNGGNAEQLILAEQRTAADLRKIRVSAQTLASNIQQETDSYRNLGSRYLVSPAFDYIKGLNTAVLRLIDAVTSGELNSSVARYTIANAQINARVTEREKEFREGSALLQGKLTDKYLAKYPTIAAELLTRMDAANETDSQAMRALLSQYNAEPPEILESNGISSLRAEALAMQARQNNLRSQGQSMAALARSQSIQAQNFRNEGNNYIRDIRAALSRKNFDVALDRVKQANTAFDQSLALEYDEATLNQKSAVIPSLEAEIEDNVFQQVSALVVNIKDAYYDNDFDGASRFISLAENTLKQAKLNPDHPDIVYWKEIIQAGQSSGRTIPVTAPLYAEMSQLLSDARRNFEEGQKLLKTFRDAEGKRLLAAARQNIQKVRRVYPQNEEAGILELRIDQVLDSDIEAKLGSKITDAIRRTRSGSQQNRIEAVNELRTIQVVFPGFTNFPGYTSWPAIINQAEIDAGLRPPPPDPRAIAQAQEIVNRARPVVASRSQDRMEETRAELAQAMRLDPNNAEARSLFNEASRIISAGKVILDSDAERLFQQASQALAQNNGIRALQLVNQIYSLNSIYRYVSRMIALEQRARAIL
ncbi:MAG: hypothetical protein LBB72_00875 [Spirochaetaceae bacterium]|jgi:hypothetical protein|nr:hypothetical protein [Spirochaetaceae bacterium]